MNTPEGERVEKFDRIYLAIGSRPANRIVSTTEGIEVDEKGYVKVVERPFGMTTRRGVLPEVMWSTVLRLLSWQ